MADSKILKPINILVRQHQFTIDPNVTIPANNIATVLNNVDIFSLAWQALDPLPSGRKLVGAVFLWANTSLCLAPDTIVYDNNKITILLRNSTSINANITNIRILAFWE